MRSFSINLLNIGYWVLGLSSTIGLNRKCDWRKLVGNANVVCLLWVRECTCMGYKVRWVRVKSQICFLKVSAAFAGADSAPGIFWRGLALRLQENPPCNTFFFFSININTHIPSCFRDLCYGTRTSKGHKHYLP